MDSGRQVAAGGVAEFDGGCSNDVLVFRAKEAINKKYLYYLLSDDII